MRVRIIEPAKISTRKRVCTYARVYWIVVGHSREGQVGRYQNST